MRIKEIVIRNFKNIGIKKECIIKVPEVDENGSSDFVTVIGENNIRKSSILEALRLFFQKQIYQALLQLIYFLLKKNRQMKMNLWK